MPMRRNVNLKHVVSFVISQWFRNPTLMFIPCIHTSVRRGSEGVVLETHSSAKSHWEYCCTVIHVSVEEDLRPLAHHELFRATNMQIILKLRGQSPSLALTCDIAPPALESIPVGFDQHPIKSQWSRPGMCNEWLCGHLFLSQWTASPPPPSKMNQCCSLKITRNIIHFMHCWVNRMCWMLSDRLHWSRMCFDGSARRSQITMQGVVGFKRCTVEAVQTAPWFWPYNSFLCGVMFLHRPSCWVRCRCQD